MFVVNVVEFNKLQNKNNLNLSQMAKKLEISRTQLWRVLNKQCAPGEQFIAGFKKAFPKEDLDKFFLINVVQQSDTSTA